MITTFEALRIGARFRWAEAPLWNGDFLEEVYVKGAADTFGDSMEWQPWIATHERAAEVISQHET